MHHPRVKAARREGVEALFMPPCGLQIGWKKPRAFSVLHHLISPVFRRKRFTVVIITGLSAEGASVLPDFIIVGFFCHNNFLV